MNILLAVTGSISAYKILDLTRELTKKSHIVKVILSKGAEKFVHPQTFKYLGATNVYTSEDDFNYSTPEDPVLHISLRNWMDIFVIAPASANTIGKLSHGLCDDLISSVFVCNQQRPCLIFPAMNSQMLTHPFVRENIAKLNTLSNLFIHPTQEGELACGEQGYGKLACVDEIFDLITTYPMALHNESVLITTGATRSPLDPVRFITNPSSGKTGYEISKAYLKKGLKVTLIYGLGSHPAISNLRYHPNFKGIVVTTTEDMYQAVSNNFEMCDIYISSAAISDIQFNSRDQKLKKDQTSTQLSFEWSTDILSKMIERKKHQKIISFAAETDNLFENFEKKWNRKPVDLLVGNKVNSGHNDHIQGFGTDGNEYFFVKNGSVISHESLSKSELAKKISNFTDQQI